MAAIMEKNSQREREEASPWLMPLRSLASDPPTLLPLSYGDGSFVFLLERVRAVLGHRYER